MNHTCHAHGCTKRVPPKMLMCLKHWRMVPKFAQDDIWRTYVPGQEVRKDPTNEYMKAQQRAIVFVLMRERGITDLREAIKLAFPHLPDKTPA